MTETFGEWVRGNRFGLRLDWRDGLVRRLDVAWADDVREADTLSAHAAALKAALLRYEARRDPDWPDLPLDFSGLSEFQLAALAELRRIPSGTTRTYGEMAALLGRPRGAQAVGRAMGANPFPILYPCHRVVGADGAMTGFSASGGMAMKKALLRLEGAEQGLLPGLE
ncbi:methylated-DNA/protein-cysteine methyltransferase [Pseudodesulfovibrio mercurii]|uniref:methylated-DNA--[protein]-cysteine S-methyltransferase n=1 Tax=Pseudodesulfovibrio mercurii TaxID=641491 RepID=F0JDA9_9BACT|nr:MGMT family protein [Pseudodesulfovibrio mercurii]EGB15783.1 methylated-DNA/protein-cysteine methyltransferase [Pseudodesulfovibrio mercurii]